MTKQHSCLPFPHPPYPTCSVTHCWSCNSLQTCSTTSLHSSSSTGLQLSSDTVCKHDCLTLFPIIHHQFSIGNLKPLSSKISLSFSLISLPLSSSFLPKPPPNFPPSQFLFPSTSDSSKPGVYSWLILKKSSPLKPTLYSVQHLIMS